MISSIVSHHFKVTGMSNLGVYINYGKQISSKELYAKFDTLENGSIWNVYSSFSNQDNILLFRIVSRKRLALFNIVDQRKFVVVTQRPPCCNCGTTNNYNT